MNTQMEASQSLKFPNANSESTDVETRRTCEDCLGLLSKDDARYCSKCWDDRLVNIYEAGRRRKAQYEVSPPGSPWIEGVSLDSIYPQDCYRRAFEYVFEFSRSGQKHQLVHGQTDLAFGGHAWVELPIGLVFDGVYQRFYRTEDYYGEMAHATPWYIYESDAAIILNAHLQASVGAWWGMLGLPMILDRPPMQIGSEDAWELLMGFYKQFEKARLEKRPLNIIRAVAKACGTKGTSRMRKAELLQVILENREPESLTPCERGAA